MRLPVTTIGGSFPIYRQSLARFGRRVRRVWKAKLEPVGAVARPTRQIEVNRNANVP